MTSLPTASKVFLGAAFAASLLAGCDKRPADQPQVPSTTPETTTPSTPATTPSPAPDSATPPAPGMNGSNTTPPPPANPPPGR